MLSQCWAANIPVGLTPVCRCPAGAIVANAATDNYAAGGLAAEKLYEMIKDKVTDPAKRSGSAVSQDANSQSIRERTGGFIDRMCTPIGEINAVVGHDKYNKAVDGAKVIIDVGIRGNG